MMFQSSPPLSPRNHLQVPSYHLTPHHLPQVTSPHLQNGSQHFPCPHVTSPHLPNPQAPLPQLPYPPVTSAQLLSPPHHPLYNQNHNLGLNNPDWTGSEPLYDISRSFCYSYQNQPTGHVDLHNQFSSGTTHQRDELPYNAHTHLTSCVYEQCDTPSPVQDPWGPAVSQLQCAPLGSMTGGAALGRWGSTEFDSSSENFSINHFFNDSYNDNNAPQPFYSPTTPGPSPHYPQTPAISSPAQIHPGKERLSFQTSRQLNVDKSCSLQEYDSYLMTSDPGPQHPQPATRHLHQSQSEPIQDQPGLHQGAAGNSESCFPLQERGQDVSGAAQSPGLPAGLSWKEKKGGGRQGGRRRMGDNIQKTKGRKPDNSTEVVKSRLLCTVCKRDFRSLPALNGHMRSHSGSRSAACFKKGEDPSSPFQTSTSAVMQISVPIQSRGLPKACRIGEQGHSRTSLAIGGIALLYRSLLHQEEEEKATGYTPPPMLCPLRAGPGLFCSVTTRMLQGVQTVQLHNTHNDLIGMETASPPPGTLINKPRINEGRDFQADIPKLRVQKYSEYDSHNALLLWTPCDELEHPVNQQRVEALLMMARSSVVPGGGASPESALHVLSECRGDILLTVEKLMSTPETHTNENNNNNNKDNKTAQQYTSVSWSAAERRLLVKSLQLHQKDFSRIQKAIQTKSLSQCVEFYYLWKKKLSLSMKTQAGLTITANA